MTKKLYHGSLNIIEKPIYGYGKTYNDYGLGFYCTDNLEMAKEWGVGNNQNGYANCYELDCASLNVLDLNDSSFCILHWLSILLENREFDIPSGLTLETKKYLLNNFSVDYSKCDIIIGYRADDSYFSFAQDFINGTISYQQLCKAMYLGKLGQQFVLKSKESFDRLKFLGYEIAQSGEWYQKKILRDRTARREYFDVEKNKWHPDDLYITQIMSEEMKSNDNRLR